MKTKQTQIEINDKTPVYIVTENGDGLHHFSFEKVDFLFIQKPDSKQFTVKTIGELKSEKSKKGESMFYVNGYGWVML